MGGDVQPHTLISALQRNIQPASRSCRFTLREKRVGTVTYEAGCGPEVYEEKEVVSPAG
jgi:hypothetical protein